MLKSKNNHSVSLVVYKQNNKCTALNTRASVVKLSSVIVEQVDPANAIPSLVNSTDITKSIEFTRLSNTKSNCGTASQPYTFSASSYAACQYLNEQINVDCIPTAKQALHPTLISQAISDLEPSVPVQDLGTHQAVNADQGINSGQATNTNRVVNTRQETSNAHSTQAFQEKGLANFLYYRAPSNTRCAAQYPSVFRKLDVLPIPYATQHLNKQLVSDL